MWRPIATISLTLVACLFQTTSAKAVGGPLTNVYVDCSVSAGDIVGGNFCYAVKEKVRASVAFRLIEEEPKIGIGVHLITLDPDANSAEAGDESVIALVLTTYTGTAGVEYYETADELHVGARRVQEMATSVLSDIDEVESDAHGFFNYQRAMSHRP
jgi:hypothetical protein